MLLLGLISAALPALVVIEHTLHKQHRPPPGVPHAEIPARIDAAAAALKDAPFAGKLDWREAGVAVKSTEAMNVLLDVHTPEHIASVRKLSQRGGGFDTDTYCAPGSWEAMVDGTAAWMEAVQVSAARVEPGLHLPRTLLHILADLNVRLPTDAVRRA